MGFILFPDRKTAEEALPFLNFDTQFGLIFYQYPVLVSKDESALEQFRYECQEHFEKEILYEEEPSYQIYELSNERVEDWLSRFDYISVSVLKQDIDEYYPWAYPLFEGRLRITSHQDWDVVRFLYFVLTHRVPCQPKVLPVAISQDPPKLNLGETPAQIW